jgi:cyclase
MAAHTTNDVLVWIPERSALFCGDLVFNGGTPFLLMGSVAGCLDVLENVVRPLRAQTVVPGHGPTSRSGRPSTTSGSCWTSPRGAARRVSPR